MAIIICDNNNVNNSKRESCKQTIVNWCCHYCFIEDCNDRCYYEVHDIDCRIINKEE